MINTLTRSNLEKVPLAPVPPLFITGRHSTRSWSSWSPSTVEDGEKKMPAGGNGQGTSFPSCIVQGLLSQEQCHPQWPGPHTPMKGIKTISKRHAHRPSQGSSQVILWCAMVLQNCLLVLNVFYPLTILYMSTIHLDHMTPICFILLVILRQTLLL